MEMETINKARLWNELKIGTNMMHIFLLTSKTSRKSFTSLLVKSKICVSKNTRLAERSMFVQHGKEQFYGVVFYVVISELKSVAQFPPYLWGTPWINILT